MSALFELTKPGILYGFINSGSMYDLLNSNTGAFPDSFEYSKSVIVHVKQLIIIIRNFDMGITLDENLNISLEEDENFYLDNIILKAVRFSVRNRGIELAQDHVFPVIPIFKENSLFFYFYFDKKHMEDEYENFLIKKAHVI